VRRSGRKVEIEKMISGDGRVKERGGDNGDW